MCIRDRLQIPRQALVELGYPRGTGRRVLYPVMLSKIPVEAPDCAQSAGSGPLGEAPPLQVCQKSTHAQPVNAGPRPLPIVPAAKILELGQVAPVCRDRMRAPLALLLQVEQKLGDFGPGYWLIHSAAIHACLLYTSDAADER